MDEYAEQESILFAEWVGEELLKANEGKQSVVIGKTTKQLYQIYQQSKPQQP